MNKFSATLLSIVGYAPAEDPPVLPSPSHRQLCLMTLSRTNPMGFYLPSCCCGGLLLLLHIKKFLHLLRRVTFKNSSNLSRGAYRSLLSTHPSEPKKRPGRQAVQCWGQKFSHLSRCPLFLFVLSRSGAKGKKKKRSFVSSARAVTLRLNHERTRP